MRFGGLFLQITVGDEDQQGQQNQRVETENSDVIEFKIESVIQQVDSKTSDVIDVENDDQQTPLHVAAKSNSVACVKYLIVAKANARARDKDFKTPLHLAAEQGHLKCVEELAEVSDVNAQDYNLNTPLHLAAKNNVSTFLFMLKHPKVDTSLTNRNFKTGIELASEHFLFNNKSFVKNWKQNKDDKMKEMSSGDQMVHLLKLAGIKVRKGNETKGDGNCFYRALNDQCFKANIFSTTHEKLRKHIVEHVEKEYDNPSRSATMNILVGCYEYENGDNSFREMIEKQKENGTWANETFIAYAANLLGIAIRVFKIEEGGLVREELFPSKLMTESEEDNTSHICIAHYDNHFQSVLI